MIEWMEKNKVAAFLLIAGAFIIFNLMTTGHWEGDPPDPDDVCHYALCQ